MLYRINQFRKEQCLTQGRLAEISGVSRATINGLETGKITTNIKVITLLKISHALNKNIIEIFA